MHKRSVFIDQSNVYKWIEPNVYGKVLISHEIGFSKENIHLTLLSHIFPVQVKSEHVTSRANMGELRTK